MPFEVMLFKRCFAPCVDEHPRTGMLRTMDNSEYLHRPSIIFKINRLVSLFFFMCAVCFPETQLSAARVALGIDVLQESRFEIIRGKRVGLITNQTGVDSRGVRTRLILHRAPEVRLVALYTPEHGLDGTEKAGVHVSSRKDPLTGLVAHSLYGPTRKPTPEMLRGIDTLVYDMQDIGCRSYTYISTMAKCMEAAGELGIEFIVLDRPNPLGGQRVEGPGISKQWISFVGQLPIPYVHGMTVGELAQMANDNGWNGPRCRLRVIPMRGWFRAMLWHDTGLNWVRTSPNIPYAESPWYYVATGIFGSLGGVDIGIGTREPFQIAAAPWIKPESLAAAMARKGLSGVSFRPAHTSSGNPGVRIFLDPRHASNLTAINLFLIDEFNKRTSKSLFARTSKSGLNLFHKVCGGTEIMEKLQRGVSPVEILKSWDAGVRRFEAARRPYLLYH